MSWLSTTQIDSGEQLTEYINNFKLNVTWAKYDEVKDTATLISYFLTGLPTWLMHCIQAMDTVPTTITGWYDKAAHFHLQKEITWKVAFMHQGSMLQNTCTNYITWLQNPQPAWDSNAMDIDALNLSPIEQSCCLRNWLCFICKKPNCSTQNHPQNGVTTHQERVPAHPIRNLEQVWSTATSEEGDLLKYVKNLEGKGKKPTELLHLLQLAVNTDEEEEKSF